LDVRRHQSAAIKSNGESSLYERRYWDAKEKYEDRIAPPNAVDLAFAEASLAEVEARLRQAEREAEKWRNGPDPDALESAQARLQAADARLTAAQTASANAQLATPISGEVVAVNVKAGEWAIPGQPLVTIADLSQWVVVTEDLGEDSVNEVKAGLPVNLVVEAYPDLILYGVSSSVNLYADEKMGMCTTGEDCCPGTARIPAVGNDDQNQPSQIIEKRGYLD
jgi:multidrug efflux pump subunit AcrA (membrane-fusion protein)